MNGRNFLPLAGGCAERVHVYTRYRPRFYRLEMLASDGKTIVITGSLSNPRPTDVSNLRNDNLSICCDYRGTAG